MLPLTADTPLLPPVDHGRPPLPPSTSEAQPPFTSEAQHSSTSGAQHTPTAEAQTMSMPQFSEAQTMSVPEFSSSHDIQMSLIE